MALDPRTLTRLILEELADWPDEMVRKVVGSQNYVVIDDCVLSAVQDEFRELMLKYSDSKVSVMKPEEK